MRIVGRRIKIIDADGDSLGAVGKTGVVLEALDGYYLLKLNSWHQGHNAGPNDKMAEDALSDRWFFSRKAFRLLPVRKRRKQ